MIESEFGDVLLPNNIAIVVFLKAKADGCRPVVPELKVEEIEGGPACWTKVVNV